MNNVATLKNWAVVGNNDGYTAPEVQRLALCGEVYNHPNPDRHHDGKKVITSYIVESKGRIVTTKSGTRYYLANPHEDYKQFLDETYPDWDPENPIKTKK